MQDTRSWVGNVQKLDEFISGILAIAVLLLRGCSALPVADFNQAIDGIFELGLSSKTFAARPYVELYSELISEELFEEETRKSLCPLFPDRQWPVEENSLLAWEITDGPGYTIEKATEMLKNRYRRGLGAIKYTLGRFKQDKRFLSIVASLRAEGLLDWQIIAIVNNLVLQERTRRMAADTGDLG